MAMKINYNADGSVTVKSGDEQVTIVAHSPAPRVSPAIGDQPQHQPSPATQPSPNTHPAPRTPQPQPQPPIIVGPPPIGPRVMILAPEYGSAAFDAEAWSGASAFMAAHDMPCLMQRSGGAVAMAIAGDRYIEVRTLVNSARGANGEELDLYVWHMPDMTKIDY